MLNEIPDDPQIPKNIRNNIPEHVKHSAKYPEYVTNRKRRVWGTPHPHVRSGLLE